MKDLAAGLNAGALRLSFVPVVPGDSPLGLNGGISLIPNLAGPGVFWAPMAGLAVALPAMAVWLVAGVVAALAPVPAPAPAGAPLGLNAGMAAILMARLRSAFAAAVLACHSLTLSCSAAVWTGVLPDVGVAWDEAGSGFRLRSSSCLAESFANSGTMSFGIAIGTLNDSENALKSA